MIRIITAAIGFGAAGLILFFYTQPTYDSIQALQAQQAQYSGALDKATQLLTLKDSLNTRYNSFSQDDINRLQTALPDHVDNVRLILDIDNLANTHQIELQNVVISTPSSETGASGAIGAIASADKYDSLTLQFTARGTYENFVSFLHDIESSLRLVDLESLQINTSGASNASSASPTYTYNITVRTYWLK